MKKRCISIVAILILALSLAAIALAAADLTQINLSQARSARNHPIGPDIPAHPMDAGDWDAQNIRDPSVISSTIGYQMWYMGNGLTFTGWGWALGRADSPDEFTWTKYGGNPILQPGEAGEWDSAYRGIVSVILENGVYKMWYTGADLGGNTMIGYATSSDGLIWDIHADNPVLSPGGPGSWDALRVQFPSVIKEGSVFKMWYRGCDGNECSFGYATSNDGVTWTKHGSNPVLSGGASGEWDEAGVAFPQVIQKNAT